MTATERQWGTVREDYSANGDAWRYFPHEHARSRAYRWGEDGIGGWCDDKQDFSVTVAFWNGKDPILKERFFGLANHEGNHGEDIKELHWYLDGTPTSSFNRMLYKYPHEAYPYERLIRGNSGLSRTGTRIRDPRYRPLRRQPLFRLRDHLGQGVTQRPPAGSGGAQPRGRRRRDPCSAPVHLHQHLDLGGGRTKARPAGGG